MPVKLVIGTIKGTCSLFNQGHTTRANLALISVVSALGTCRFSLSACEQMLVTTAVLNSAVRGERH